ncbi:MAG: LPS assembly lipoprotein LptE [Brevundimonas sp.]|uniref:LPS assembly lipoprotein LptE n=1 Tax=Brevundimonas sp. TaxID=1871086 RepID=UPI00391A98FF
MRRAAAVATLAVALSALAGCGFTPLYAELPATGLSQVAVSTPDDRLGYRVREQLEDALGRTAGGAVSHRLEIALEPQRRPLGRRIDDTAVRYELVITADWTLTPAAGGAPLTGREIVTITYATADQPYAAIAAQQDGEERAAADLARRLRLSLMRALAE